MIGVSPFGFLVQYFNVLVFSVSLSGECPVLL